MSNHTSAHSQANGIVMEPNHPAATEASVSLDDPRVHQAMEDYLKRLQAGERPDRDDFLACYPEVAEALAICLQGLDFVHAAGAELSQPAEGKTDGEAVEPPECLGDFRIVREVGRGGMGVVYEAVQLSLGRRVALKVLPFAATMDPRHLQRFHNEARAAASLEHPHIVPVYAVGSERGVHFYAMKFIEGRTLEALLSEWQQPIVPSPSSPSQRPFDATVDAPVAAAPTVEGKAQPTERLPVDTAHFRRIATWGMQAAEALDYAHSLGVVHRDIKPANVMLDAQGQVWVTDFGLARFGTDSGLTMTGDLLGTLRYMSPEQALAKHKLVDHRTDIYSLGVTLYELLTQTTAVAGSNREEVLRNIAFEEPKPPRRIDRRIPADLETIVLKAIAKEPTERYATAAELADDLRRLLEDRPIQARRPSWVQVARKAARRHRHLVGAGGILVVIALALAAGNWQWWAQKRAAAEGEARAALREATELQQSERWPEALSAARRAEGVLQGVGADPRLAQQAGAAVRDFKMALRLQEIRLRIAAVSSGGFDYQTGDAEYAVAFREYGLDLDTLEPQAVVDQIRQSSIHEQLVAALDNWAHVRHALKREDWKALLAATRVADPDRWRNRLRDAVAKKDPKILEEVAAAHAAGDCPAQTLVLLATLAEAMKVGNRVVVLLERAQQRDPGDFWINTTLGKVLGEVFPHRLEEALRYSSIAVALRPRSAAAHLNLGAALADLGRLDEGIAEFRVALQLEGDLVLPHLNLGNVFRQKGQLDEAIVEYREALRLKQELPQAHWLLGIALSDKRLIEDAIAEFHQAIRLKSDFGRAHNSLGIALYHKGRLQDAMAEYRQALDLGEERAAVHNNMGVLLRRQREFDRAIVEFREAIRIQKDVFKSEFPDAHYNLGLTLMNQSHFDTAAAELRRAEQLFPPGDPMLKPVRRNLRLAEQLGDLDHKLPAFLKGEKRFANTAERLAFASFCQNPSKQLYAAAARWYAEAFHADPAIAGMQPSALRYNAASAAALAGCGRGRDARGLDGTERARLRRQALDWLQADLRAWRALFKKEPAKTRLAISAQLQHWLEDPDFNEVRGAEALARLPQDERAAWQRLWADVAETRARVHAGAGPNGGLHRPD